MISIICPVYNNEKYLIECVNSVLCQSFSDWELLLIDDGSTDGSSVICDKFANQDKRIKTFHKPNQGQWLTREFGIEKSSGDYFIFLDSDDMLETNALDTIYNAIKETGSDVFLYDICKLNPDGTKICLQELYEKKCVVGVKNIINFCFVENNCISLCVYCFKKDFYSSCSQKLGIDKTIKSQEDFLMLFNILQQLLELIVIPKILYVYRTNDNSASSTLRVEDYYKNVFISSDIYKTIFEKYNSDLDSYSNKIKKRLAWQPISFIKRAYRDLKRKEQKDSFSIIKKTFIYEKFTKKYKFESKKDRLFFFLFRRNLHWLNKLLTDIK